MPRRRQLREVRIGGENVAPRCPRMQGATAAVAAAVVSAAFVLSFANVWDRSDEHASKNGVCNLGGVTARAGPRVAAPPALTAPAPLPRGAAACCLKRCPACITLFRHTRQRRRRAPAEPGAQHQRVGVGVGRARCTCTQQGVDAGERTRRRPERAVTCGSGVDVWKETPWCVWRGEGGMPQAARVPSPATTVWALWTCV
eukprot:365051-Chlamydomonas_euryale.AAC.5